MLSMIWTDLGGDIEIVGTIGNGGARLGSDATLRTAILVSLFTDRRAASDDVLPDDGLPGHVGGDRRGWVGDALSPIADDRIGSRLWLLRRRKQDEQTRLDAEDYCREALAWLVEDAIASSLDVSAEWQSRGFLGALITITLVSGERQAFAYSVAAGGV